MKKYLLLLIVFHFVVISGVGFGQIHIPGCSDNPPAPRNGLILELLSGNQTLRSSGGINYVAQWNDTSGNSRNATQTTESKQPSLGNAGYTVFTNAQYVVEGPSFIASLSTEFTVLAKTFVTATTYTQSYLFSLHDGALGHRFIYYFDNGPDLTLYDGEWGAFVDNEGAYWRGSRSESYPTSVGGPSQVVGFQKSTTRSLNKLIVNGVKYSTNETILSEREIDPLTNVCYLGSYGGGSYPTSRLWVKGIRVYSRILSQRELNDSVSWSW